MIIRTADALGLDGAIFCKSCDVYNPKAIRSTMGAIFRIPVYRNVEKEELLEALNEAGLKSYAAVVNNAERDVKRIDFSKGGAVFIGNEGNGLDSSRRDSRTGLRRLVALDPVHPAQPDS